MYLVKSAAGGSGGEVTPIFDMTKPWLRIVVSFQSDWLFQSVPFLRCLQKTTLVTAGGVRIEEGD